MTRRNALAASFAAVVGAVGFGLHSSLRTKTYDFATPKWPEQSLPLRIVFLADLHAGCLSVGLEELEIIVDRVNALQPDIILIGGDSMTKDTNFGTVYISPEQIAAKLGKLAAPLGIFNVHGNHDWRTEPEALMTAFKNVGIETLENSNLLVRKNGHSFWIAGMADSLTRKPDYRKTMEGIPKSDPVIIMAHNPVVFDTITKDVALMFAGHTHGPQINLPYLSYLIPGTPGRFGYGHISERNCNMVVTGGIGTSRIPLRLWSPPEIVSMTVRNGLQSRMMTP